MYSQLRKREFELLLHFMPDLARDAWFLLIPARGQLPSMFQHKMLAHAQLRFCLNCRAEALFHCRRSDCGRFRMILLLTILLSF
jgi:hypothetical protein